MPSAAEMLQVFAFPRVQQLVLRHGVGIRTSRLGIARGEGCDWLGETMVK
jgi:hypothetical protein